MHMRVFSVVWLLLCAGLMVLAWGFKTPFSYDPVGPRAYPLLLLSLMSLGAVWLLINPGSVVAKISIPVAVRAVLCVFTLLGYALLFESLGFIVSTTVAVFCLGLLFTGKPLGCAVTGLSMSLLLFGLFDYLLDVPLPLGVLSKVMGG